MEGIVCGMEISMEYISDAQAKQMILEVGRRMYPALWQRTTEISPVKSEIMRSGQHLREFLRDL